MQSDILKQMARPVSEEVVLVGSDNSEVSWADFEEEVYAYVNALSEYRGLVVAIYLDNSPLWVMLDLACQITDVISLPIPAFFSDKQIKHALQQAGAAFVIHQRNDHLSQLIELSEVSVFSEQTVLSSTDIPTVELPHKTSKITFTSGSSGSPKGVCLSHQHQLATAQTIIEQLDLSSSKHLAVLPFSTLLENIAGIYGPLLNGRQVIALPLSDLGFDGGSQFNIKQFIYAVEHYQPNSMILLPELLMALMSAIEHGWKLPASVMFIAVGGSKVSVSLLQKAALMGLPVYEGYGLSECASVVALNTPTNNRIGSVGKVLPHVKIDTELDEIVVSEGCFLGYVGQTDSWYPESVKTGDLGQIDDDGYLYVKGRSKNTLITSYGRNINPEWLESELLATGLFNQAIVFGDAQPFCIALCVLRTAETSKGVIANAIVAINTQLPEYAHIKRWHCLDKVMSAENGLYTRNGRPVRSNIFQKYKLTIEQLYKD